MVSGYSDEDIRLIAKNTEVAAELILILEQQVRREKARAETLEQKIKDLMKKLSSS